MADHPSLFAIGLFLAKSRLHQATRTVANFRSGLSPLPAGNPADFPFLLSESISPLYTATDPRERPLIVGKIQNLRMACQYFHGRVLLPGETCSFWKQVGPPWKSRGFALGREVREGCVIPTMGGGLCQLSGSLLEVIAPFDFKIIERHRHTALPPDVSRASWRDATVFWNYIDLRFQSRFAVLFEAYVTEDSLIVQLRGKSPQLPVLNSLAGFDGQEPRTLAPARSCSVCSQTECVRHGRDAGSH